MTSLAEVAADLNAIKTERSHTRIVLPSEAQEDENYKLIAELLAGTGIEQAELAAISLGVASSALQSLNAVDGGIDAMEMMGLIGSLWIDGVILGARYMAERGTGDVSEPTDATDGPEEGETP